MQVPNEDYSESVEFQLRTALAEASKGITELQKELEETRLKLRREVLERDHWFESAKTHEKTILNLAQALNRDGE